MSSQKKKHYRVGTNTRIYDLVTYFAYKIKSGQNQNLCFKSFNSHCDKGIRKDLQSILASSLTSLDTLTQISQCWVTSKYGFLSMVQVRIILHTLLRPARDLEVLALWNFKSTRGAKYREPTLDCCLQHLSIFCKVCHRRWHWRVHHNRRSCNHWSEFGCCIYHGRCRRNCEMVGEDDHLWKFFPKSELAGSLSCGQKS